VHIGGCTSQVVQGYVSRRFLYIPRLTYNGPVPIIQAASPQEKHVYTDAQTDQSLNIPGAPDIPGLSFRNFRDDEDYVGILDVNTRSKIADGINHDLHTLGTIRQTYNSTHNYDPRRDMLIAEVSGKMVAFIRIFWDMELDGHRGYWFFGFVAPEWRGKGLELTLLIWAEGHARDTERTLDSVSPAEISTAIYLGQPSSVTLLTEAGYKPVRYAYNMETPDLDHIPDVPMPEGLEVRPALPEHYHDIWYASAEAFQDHWGATPIDEADFETMMKDPYTNPSLWVVAWDGDQVAGSILNFVMSDINEQSGRKLGYTESISVCRPWRRIGLARALLSRSMQMFKDMGMTQTALGVDALNPSGALQLYESMGYKVIAESTTYRKLL
jgi:mycothiol synthase